MSIQVIKLITGEEIIAKVTDIQIEGRDLIQVNQPAIIILMPNDDNPNQAQIGLAPWVPYAENATAHIMPAAVTAVVNPKKELIVEYEKLYGTNSPIITPNKEIVTPLATK
jgi:hypothetical protein